MKAHMNPQLPPHERASLLLKEMTVEEKVAQLGSIWAYEVQTQDAFDPVKANRLFANGMGEVTRLGGCTSLKPEAAARLGNQIQRALVEETRLGIPALIHEESCAGYLTAGADIFPQAIGIAASFDPELAARMGEIIREQMMALGARQALAPLLDVTRDPRWGRTEETYGEDPYLVSRMGVRYIQGLQGDSLADGLLATGKHFVGYGMCEGGMNWAPPHIAPRELEEVYLFPFEAAVREAKLHAIMPAYHELDGIPCHINHDMLRRTLRERWGFDGLLVSDYFAIQQVMRYHHACADYADAARRALEAGMDVELPSTICYGQPLLDAVREGSIPEALLDESVLRMLTCKFALGLFENPYVDVTKVAQHFRNADQRQFAYTSAVKTITLLKNDGILPLKKADMHIAVIGPNADQVRNMLGDYSYPAHVEYIIDQNHDNFAGTPTPDTQRDPDAALPEMDSILTGLRKKLPDACIEYAMGCGIEEGDDALLAEAISLAERADIVIAVMGDKAGMVRGCTSGETRDRVSLELPGHQQALLKAVHATGKPIIGVLIHGRPFALKWEDEHLNALLTAWLPGQEGSRAVADVLSGDVSPAGRLPITFPRHVGQIPTYYAHRPSGGRSYWKTEYVDESNLPLYPFGYGLSYTHFTYSDLHLPQSIPTDGVLCGAFTLTNDGAMDGDEVVQLYIQDLLAADVTRPVKELKGFLRVSLRRGESKRIRFEVDARQLAFLNSAMEYVVEPGEMRLMLGRSSADICLESAFRLEGRTMSITEKVYHSRLWVD